MSRPLQKNHYKKKRVKWRQPHHHVALSLPLYLDSDCHSSPPNRVCSREPPYFTTFRVASMIAWLFMHRLLCMASPAEGTPTTRSLTAQPQTRRYKAIYESHPFCNPGEVGVTCENVRMAERVANAALKKTQPKNQQC